jgi:hypothetical protein
VDGRPPEDPEQRSKALVDTVTAASIDAVSLAESTKILKATSPDRAKEKGKMDTIRSLGAVLGILVFLVLMKQKVTDALTAIGAPASLNFYFLFFWALAAAFVGGLGWAVCQHLFPSLSATSCVPTLLVPIQSLGGAREPHGLAALLWPIVTNTPIILLFAFIMERHHLLTRNILALLVCVVLVGFALSSVLFYDLSLFGQQGFRCWLRTRIHHYEELELVLVLIWSAILSIIPFCLVFLGGKLEWWPLVPISGVVQAVAFAVGITSLIVTFFVVAYPSTEFESARGILADLALRISLFFGLILTMIGQGHHPL